MGDLPDTMSDLPDTMGNLPDTMGDLPDTMGDLPAEVEKSNTFRGADFCEQKLSRRQKKIELKICDKRVRK